MKKEEPLTYRRATYNFASIADEWTWDIPWFESDGPNDVSPAMAVAKLVDQAAEIEKVWPQPKHLYRSLYLTPGDEVKVVMLGQDPYPTAGNANGMAFSVQSGQALPGSLKNIFAELKDDLGIENTSGFLRPWADQGVLLLNNALSVVEGRPGSHSALWSGFTDQVIAHINKRKQPTVFILWGAHARRFAGQIEPRHLVIESYHPSPLSAHQTGKDKFFGSKPFSKANKFLKKNKRGEIDWST